MKKIAFVLFIIAAAGLAFGAPLADRKKKCEDLVNKAIAHYQKVGAAKCFADISDPKGALVEGEFYVFGYDFAGTCVAHGQFKERVGKNFLDASDPNGVKTVLEHIKVAKAAAAEGWDFYSFRNPTTKAIEKKTSFVKRIPGKDILLGCGTYLD